MIKINRNKVSAPDALVKDGRIGPRELDRVKNWMDEKLKSKPTFNAYKDDAIKQKFMELFNGKCAYCESKYTKTQPVDVEHWRPKSRVTYLNPDEIDEVGYPWLAMEWDNLLPSCIDCNRARYHEVLNIVKKNGENKIERLKIKQGKHDSFPLFNRELKPKHYKDEMEKGNAILLNPCEDDPEKFFEYDEHGLILPKKRIRKKNRERAIASIRIYGLNREGLTAGRLVVIMQFNLRIKMINRIAELKNRAEGDDNIELVKALEDISKSELLALEEATKPDQEYSALSKQLFKDFFEEIS